MKKIIAAILMIGMASPAFAQLGAIITGVSTVAAPLIQGAINKKKEEKMLKKSGCFDENNKKIAGWESSFSLPALDLETERKKYYAQKKASQEPAETSKKSKTTISKDDSWDDDDDSWD